MNAPAKFNWSEGRFGPDTEWLPDEGPIDYPVDATRGDGFYAGYFRDLDGNKLNVFCLG